MKNSWTPKTVSLIGTMPDVDLAKRLGITKTAVGLKRLKLKIPSFTLRGKVNWGPTELGLFRNYTDSEIVKMTGRSLADVKSKRRLAAPR